MNELIIGNGIAEKILTIRGVQVMLDRDLAELYGIETWGFNRFFYDFYGDKGNRLRDEALNVRCNALNAQHNLALDAVQGDMVRKKTCPVGTTQSGVCVVPTGQVSGRAIGNMGRCPMLNGHCTSFHCCRSSSLASRVLCRWHIVSTKIDVEPKVW